jgi:hypothetical protein
LRFIQTDNPSSRDSSFFWAGPADAMVVNLGRRTFDDDIDASVPTGCIRGGGPTLTWVKIVGWHEQSGRVRSASGWSTSQ